VNGTHAPSVPSSFSALCQICFGQDPTCTRCEGNGYLERNTYDARLSGEQVEEALPSQPAPAAGLAPHTVDLVVADLAERKRYGVKKYGVVAHQHDNGRNHLVDLYEELLDGAVYVRAELERDRELKRLAGLVEDQINSTPVRELLRVIRGGRR
jgi:hypothetical protein